MRASLGNGRLNTRGKVVGFAVASVLAVSVLGGGIASGANSRILYIGTDLVDSTGAIIDEHNNDTLDPVPDGIPDNAGVLYPTPVNAGFSTAVPIQVVNADNQTIAHVLLSFPSTGSIASGLTITDIGGTDAGACSKVIDPDTLVVTGVACNFDNLPAGAVRSFFVVVYASGATTTPPALFTAHVTTNNENGSNLQLFEASSGGFAVQAAATDALNDFVAPGQLAKTYNTNVVGGSNKLQTKLNFNQSTGGNLVSIAETDAGATTFLYTCPEGLTCQPLETTITIEDGLSGSPTEFTSPFLAVTLTALVPKTYTLSKAFVAHYGADPLTPDWILYWGNKSTRCGTNVAATLATMDQCFKSATLSKANSDGFQTLVLQVLTKHNGGYKF
jgi:hypothetical protein